ncbi:DUF1622 domain-containing protein [Enterococcus sp. DIV0660C]|uniref:DUF1622 domain-containing protein n=1 Tax=Enterococcus sp. DIV0660C TaxID=2230880 RepID=UPI001A8C6A3D|nr:DUF1622 domain-containing protein [Enterococcus sp. DIV0660C]MBO0431752.1 DUF1622 domain-containing protein [Enterococcus sp. DIV0660C]
MKDMLNEQFLSYAQYLVLGFNFLAILLLLWGAVLSAKDFLYFSFDKQLTKQEKIKKNTEIKKMLGGYILLSLEIIISAGIIESIIKPTLKDIFQLAALVGIRTIISYFLNEELGAFDSSENER